METLRQVFNEVSDHVKTTDTIQRKVRERLARDMQEQREQGDQEGRVEQRRPAGQGMAVMEHFQRADLSQLQLKLRRLGTSLERSKILGNLSATAISIGIVSCPVSLLCLAQDTQPAVVWITGYIIAGVIDLTYIYRIVSEWF
jgi:hypothetical protein